MRLEYGDTPWIRGTGRKRRSAARKDERCIN